MHSTCGCPICQALFDEITLLFLQVIAKFDFAATHESELGVTAGEHLLLKKAFSDGWCRVERIAETPAG